MSIDSGTGPTIECKRINAFSFILNPGTITRLFPPTSHYERGVAFDERIHDLRSVLQ